MARVRSAVGLLALLCGGCHWLTGLDEHVPPAPVTSPIIWRKHLGGTGGQKVTVAEIDLDGNILIGGVFSGAIDLGGEPLVSKNSESFFVAKLAPDGEHVWSRSFGDANETGSLSMAVGRAGEVVVAGSFRGQLELDRSYVSGSGANSLFVVKFDTLGEVLWSRTTAPSSGFDENPRGVVVDQDREVVIVGEFVHDMAFEHNDKLYEIVSEGTFWPNIFVLRLDRSGGFRSLTQHGDSEGQVPEAVVTDGLNTYIAGTTWGSVDFDGGVIETHGETDPFIVKLDDRDRFVWGGAIGDEEKNCHEWCEQALAMSPSGRVLYTGAFTGGLAIGDTKLSGPFGADVFLFSLDGNGSQGGPKAIWGESFGDVLVQRPYYMKLDGESPVVAGMFNGEIDFGGGPLVNDDYASDIFVAGFELDGTHRYSLSLPIRRLEAVSEFKRERRPVVAVAPNGDLLVAGRFFGEIDLGDERWVATSGGGDAFIVLLRAADLLAGH